MGARKLPGHYVPLDVNLSRDSAIRTAGYQAELLYVRGLQYVKSSRSAGFIPDYDLVVVAVGIPNAKKNALKLVESGLWERAEGGHHVRSWAKWNPFDPETDKIRQKQRLAAARTNHLRWHSDNEQYDPDCCYCNETAPDMESVYRSVDRPSVSDNADRSVSNREQNSSNRELPTDADASGERPELEALCNRLADHVVRNNFARPKLNTAALRAARLLLDRDGYTVRQVEWVIDFTAGDSFWYKNARSMPKLREKFDRIKADALEASGQGGPSKPNGDAPKAAPVLLDWQDVEEPPDGLSADEYRAWNAAQAAKRRGGT